MNREQLAQYREVHERLGNSAPFIYWMGSVLQLYGHKPGECEKQRQQSEHP